MKVAVTTPTGKIGSKVVQILLDKGVDELVLLAREPESLGEAQVRGAKVVQGDLADADYLVSATEGADSLFFLIPWKLDASDYRAYQNLLADNAANAVEVNGINYVVLLSSIGGHLDDGTGLVKGLHDAEYILRSTAANLTILRPAYFMDNYLMCLDSIVHMASIYLPVSGRALTPMIATSDIAGPAVDALLDAEEYGTRVVGLHGPSDYRFDDVAEIISEIVNHRIKHVPISNKQAFEYMRSIGASHDFADMFVELYEAIESGHLRAEFERSMETTTQTLMEEFCRKELAPALRSMAQKV